MLSVDTTDLDAAGPQAQLIVASECIDCHLGRPHLHHFLHPNEMDFFSLGSQKGLGPAKIASHNETTSLASL